MKLVDPSTIGIDVTKDGWFAEYERHMAARAEDVGWPERTNLDRAINGRDMAALALTGSNHLAYEDYEEGLTDALANLMHFARRYEIDFEAKLSLARGHHSAESAYGWDDEISA